MSRTPICDRWEYESHSGGLVVPLNVAQELESGLADKDQQLAEARAEIEHKNKLIEQMREALRLALPEAWSTHVEQTILAALAAERGE